MLMGVLRISGAGYLRQRRFCLSEDFSSLQSRVREAVAVPQVHDLSRRNPPRTPITQP